MPVYKSAKGTYYASFYYTDWQGVRHRKKKEGFKTQREAKAYERQFIERYTATPTISFPSLVDAYLEDCRARLKGSTMEQKENTFKKHITPFFSTYAVDEVTPVIVRQWQNTLLASTLSRYTIKRINGQLSSVFRFAVKYYGLSANPVSIAGSIGEKKKRIDYYTIDEFRIFMHHIDNPMYVALLTLLFWSGLRIGEALALSWDDIDFASHTVSVDKTFSIVYGKPSIRTPKTKESIRTVLLPSFMMVILEDYNRMTYDTSGRVFPILQPAIPQWNRGLFLCLSRLR